MDSAIRSLNELRLGSADRNAAIAADDKTGVELKELQAQGMNESPFDSILIALD